MFRSKAKTYAALFGIFLSLVLITTVVLRTFAEPVQTYYNHFLSTHYNDDGQYDDNVPPGGLSANLAQEQYSDQAYPNAYVGYNQVMQAYNAYLALSRQPSAAVGSSWHLLGPMTGNVSPLVTYTGRATTASGRVTALVVSPNCSDALCRVWVGAAGGGVWESDNGLSPVPIWQSSSSGLASNAIGSIALDPNDPTGATLYAGTGEENGSSDSEAGVGLYRSIDYGQTWQLVPGSVAVAKDRAIGTVAIDPTNPQHIFIGTDVARHGASSVNGGRMTPPDAPQIGLYESTDGGATFTLAFSKPSDSVDPTSPNGSDFFRGGVSNIVFNNTGLASGWRVYFSMFDYGLFRSTGSGTYEQVFSSVGGGTVANSAGARTEFALAPDGSKLRIYLGDTDGNTADFYRVDDANIPASTLTDGTNNPGWTKLSNATKGTPGYASYNFCNPQCSYDMPIASPPGQPDNVWIGGSMQYSEIFTANPPSNGRAVQRSSDAGVDFTDMTDDAQTPPMGMHPDEHVIAFDPANPDIAFIGSDGGLVRTSGAFSDTSSSCATRGLTGADLTDCQSWLKAVPTQIFSLNDGLATVQFQSITVNPLHPKTDVIGGSQDNGTWAYTENPKNWVETVGGDGGQSLIDYSNPLIRMHTYYGPSIDVNFNGDDPAGWNYISDPLTASKEASSFYVPLVADPQVSGTMFVGLEHIWRTVDSGGPQAYLLQHCNEQKGDFQQPCGDWQALGTATLTSTTYGADRSGGYIAAISRAPGAENVLWAATRFGRLFISTNVDAPAASVTFTRLDTAAQPGRFISGIAVDPTNPYHAFVTYSGYNAYTPTTTGHVFDVTFNPTSGTATWKDVSYNLGDSPVTGVAYDNQSGNLYISTDFGVALLASGSTTWANAAPGLPMVAVYSLSISVSGRVLYAATHGRGAWRLGLA